MAETVECFYSLSSPWAYLGGPRFEEIARRRGARIVLRPFEWFRIVPQNGGIPLRTRPQARQDYHALELDRWRRFLQMPLNLKPRYYPTDNIPAGHMVIAAQQAGLDAQKLSHAILKALWADERDIADPTTRAAIANEIGMDGDKLLEAENAPEVVAEFHANSDAALQQGVFGSPTYLYKGERFWGQDRLDFLDRAMAGMA
jgi:2-hydroxychromene-2-carboxylate isomerase